VDVNELAKAILRAQAAQAEAKARRSEEEREQLPLISEDRYLRPEVERAQLADRPRRKRRR